MKKIFILLSMLILSIILSSCKTWVPYDLEECESGYFKYHIYEGWGNERTYVYLVGLTELGKQQKELTMPKYIDGLKIDGLGYERPVGGKLPIFGGMQAGNEVVYFDSEGYSGKIFFNTFYLGDLGNFYLLCHESEIVIWKDNITLYNVGTAIVGYNFCHNNFNKRNINYKLANVSYMYNYQNSPYEGYYWVDSYDSELITFIPPNPEREGYKFEGWYKEEDCINKWDFNIDKTGEELIIEENSQYNEYPGIYLYAKWVKM